MAHVSILDDAVGAVAGESIPEGRIVTINASGVHRDLPVAMLAASGTTTNIFMAFAVPDQFPRPTPAGMFLFNDTTSLNPRDTTLHSLTTDFETAYLIGPSVLSSPTMISGWLVALHRGGYYKLLSGEYNAVDSRIRTNGAKVRVGANGMVEYDAGGTQSIGFVREYNHFDGSITVTIKEL
jgi:hypothetical protein